MRGLVYVEAKGGQRVSTMQSLGRTDDWGEGEGGGVVICTDWCMGRWRGTLSATVSRTCTRMLQPLLLNPKRDPSVVCTILSLLRSDADTPYFAHSLCLPPPGTRYRQTCTPGWGHSTPSSSSPPTTRWGEGGVWVLYFCGTFYSGPTQSGGTSSWQLWGPETGSGTVDMALRT